MKLNIDYWLNSVISYLSYWSTRIRTVTENKLNMKEEEKILYTSDFPPFLTDWCLQWAAPTLYVRLEWLRVPLLCLKTWYMILKEKLLETNLLAVFRAFSFSLLASRQWLTKRASRSISCARLRTKWRMPRYESVWNPSCTWCVSWRHFQLRSCFGSTSGTILLLMIPGALPYHTRIIAIPSMNMQIAAVYGGVLVLIKLQAEKLLYYTMLFSFSFWFPS